MPDWSYHPLFRPFLFRLPAETARDLTLFSMGKLASLPGGPLLIETMGHMAPPQNLQRTMWGITFPSPVGLGAGLDIHTLALPALAKFGFGFLEIGPVTCQAITGSQPVKRLPEKAAIWYPEPLVNDGVEKLAERLWKSGPLPIPLGIRLAFQPGSGACEAANERRLLMDKLSSFTAFFTLDTTWQADGNHWRTEEWKEHLHILLEAASKPLLLSFPPDMAPETIKQLLQPAIEAGIQGVLLSGGINTDNQGRLVGAPTLDTTLERIRYLRGTWPELPIIGSGGITEPEHALRLLDAGASFVQIHSGLVYSGPGLPKRINEAISYDLELKTAETPVKSGSLQHRNSLEWICGALLGAGMVIGGVLAWMVAATKVVLPYDEAFCGITRTQMEAINSRLLPFMSHDRISLAGTMISIGVIYFQLALFGLRQGLHWARQVLLYSGSVGFISFFLFIGFGYLDPLHALLSASLFPLFLIALRNKGRAVIPVGLPPNLRNDSTWYKALQGQLLFVMIGFGLCGAGLIISIIGITDIFVASDLVFLQTSPQELQYANQRLLPLIAHDRAGFGGALFSDGLAVLLISLWGFRQGARWIWWTLLLAGLPGFLTGIGIHFAVGYIDFWHLAPAYMAFLFFAAGLILSFPYFFKKASVYQPIN